VNPVAAIAHFLAVVIGVGGAFFLMGGLASDLPDADEAPGVAIPEEEIEGGGDEASLYRPGPLSTAIFQLEEQKGDDVEYVYLTLTPSSLEVSEETVDGGIEPSFLSVGEPGRVIAALGRERPEVTADGVRQMDLVATAEGPVWFVQLDGTDPKIESPLSYVVPYGSERFEAGGPPDPLVR